MLDVVIHKTKSLCRSHFHYVIVYDSLEYCTSLPSSVQYLSSDSCLVNMHSLMSSPFGLELAFYVFGSLQLGPFCSC